MITKKTCTIQTILLLVAVVTLAGASRVHAVGTAAGTAITNFATGNYTDANGNTYAQVTSNSVTTTVSQVAGVDVTPATAAISGEQGTQATIPATITNTGNGNDTDNLVAVSDQGWTMTIYLDDNGNGVLDPGETTVVTDTGVLGADGEYDVVLAIDIPGGTANGTTSDITLTGTSQFDGGVTDVGTYTLTVQDAVLVVTKTVDPATGNKPGDTVTYALTGENTGTATAESAVMTDLIPANTTYVPGSIRVGPVGGTYAAAAAKTDAVGDDEADYNITNPGAITMAMGDRLPGISAVIYFQVTVNAAIAEGTTIANTAKVNYEVGGVPQPEFTSTPASFDVAHSPAVLVLPETLTTNQVPGDLNEHAFSVKNTSNGNDTYNLTSVGLFWTWTIYNDVNGDGLYTDGVDTLVTDTNADGTVDTGIITAGDTKLFVATTTVTGLDGQVGRHDVTATSIVDGNVNDASTKFTNIQTPAITVAKAVAPAGNQPPGTELTYTITVENTGSASGQSVIITDALSGFLAYTPASITVAGAAQTDAAGDDFARYDSGSTTVIVEFPSLSAGASLAITFKATIE